MIHFEAFLAKHGEVVVQAVLENWERFMGICHSAPVSLEDRWQSFMQEDFNQEFAAA